MYKEYLLKLLQYPHFSEKSSFLMDSFNTFVFKVDKNSNKSDIKIAVQQLFNVNVINVRTMIVKGKIKRNKKSIGRRSDWKKAYITLKKGEKVELIHKFNN